MFTGIIFALIACFIWGTVFVIPQYLLDFSSLEVAFGRYFTYGLLSCFLFLRKGSSFPRYSKEVWKKAFSFALFSNILYYPALVIGLRYATAPVTVLITGLCPILVALWGNFKEKECSFTSLILPSLWIFLGTLLVNLSQLYWSPDFSSWKYCFGLAGAFAALMSWTLFAVKNATFLKLNPEIPKSEWSTLIGVATFVCTTALLLILGFIEGSGVDFHKFTTLPLGSLGRFFLWVTFLGLLCSWVGCYLWNEASAYLPISVMGPLIILETIFGLFFVFLYEHRLPSGLECAGIASMLWGITTILYLFRRTHTTVLEKNLKEPTL